MLADDSGRVALRLKTIRDVLSAYCGNRERVNHELPSPAKWQAYESLKDGISPKGIVFYMHLAYPEDSKNSVFMDLLDRTIREAYQEFISTIHYIDERKN